MAMQRTECAVLLTIVCRSMHILRSARGELCMDEERHCGLQPRQALLDNGSPELRIAPTSSPYATWSGTAAAAMSFGAEA